jgi:hypothetical protein
MADHFDISGYEVPQTPYRESNGLYHLASLMQQKRHWDYLQQRYQNENQWKKAEFVNNATDPTKYRTGDDTADAITDGLFNGVRQKYANATNMNPMEMVSSIGNDTSRIIAGAQGIRDDLSTADKVMQILKQAHPTMDVSTLYDDYRKAVVHQHINDNATDFKDPLSIGQPMTADGKAFDLSNPDIISRYMKDTKGLDKIINDRTGLEDQPVMTGTPTEHVPWKTKVPFYMQKNFSEQNLNGGYLPTNFKPSLSIKGVPISSDAYPALKNQDRSMVSQDVYQRFKTEDPLSVQYGTRKMFPSYDNMNENDKEVAERDFLYKYLQESSLPQYSAGEGTHTPASILKLNMSNTAAGSNINDVYGRIDNALSDREKQGQSFLPVSLLDPDEKDIILSQSRSKERDLTDDEKQAVITKAQEKADKDGVELTDADKQAALELAKPKKYSDADLQIIRGNDESIRVFDNKGNFVNFVRRIPTNFGKQVGKKEKEDVIKKGNVPIKPQKGELD